MYSGSARVFSSTARQPTNPAIATSTATAEATNGLSRFLASLSGR